MSEESNSHESYIAYAWFDGCYTEDQARVSCEFQGLNFENVVCEYGKLYHEQEAASHGYWELRK